LDAGRAGAGDRFDFGRGAPWSSPKAAAVGQGSEELSSEGESVILLRINLGHERVSPLDRLLALRISRKVKTLGIGEAESSGGGTGAIDLEVSVIQPLVARTELAAMMAKHFPKVSFAISE